MPHLPQAQQTMNTDADALPTGLAGIAARLQRGSTIHHSAFVAPNATVVGDVTLEADSSVWYGAVLRGDINRIVVGSGSNIQDCAVIHLADDFPALIGRLVTVGHSAIVHACIIRDEVLVGMGAIVLDGAEIGPRSIIGANALVTAGTRIPAGSLVLGSPAKIARQLTAEEQQRIKKWALNYVEIAKHFRAQLTR
ncbi:MAG: gamma carbonic anhydrase family protein [Verrucomicrobiota bacterium]|nr:gamma carbonic anhydrase family protein [Verrucomicrobiota bacterium]